MRAGVVQQLVLYITADKILKFVTLLGSLYILILLYLGISSKFSSWNKTYSKNHPKAQSKNSSNSVVIEKEKEFVSDDLPDDLTVVTAYFNLGTFQKGKFQTFTTDTYKHWMESYGMLNNTVIAFTDSSEIAFRIQSLRENFPAQMTKVVKLERDTLWAFKLAPKIKNIFDQPGYPQFPPNTVNEYYSCAMHAKYELIEKVIREKMYKTKYVAWMDIGYFRQHEYKPFRLLPQKDIKDDHISFVQINEFHSTLTPVEIIDFNYVWIAGGFFVGRPEYLLIFVADYKQTVLDLIAENLMSTDQQVLYIMYSKATDFKPRIPLRTYSHPCKCDWFYLGELCRERWEGIYRKTVARVVRFLFLIL